MDDAMECMPRKVGWRRPLRTLGLVAEPVFFVFVKYGKIPDEEQAALLPEVDFTLPSDHADTARYLSSGLQGDGVANFELRTGGTMWTIRAWKGGVYPEKAPQRTWPVHYGRAFGTIEFNATHYRIHPAERMAEWADAMPEGFRFCAKFPAIISHYRRFNDCVGPTDDFIAGLHALGSKRGPSFIQLPPHFAPHHGEQLVQYLGQWPREFEVAVEFRHPGWFGGGAEAERVWEAMGAMGIGAVISDTALRRDAVHMRMTAPFLLLRFGGYEGHASDRRRLSDWCDRLVEWRGQGLQSVDVLVHQPDSVGTPDTCRLFAELAEERLGVQVKVPMASLF